VKNPRRTQTISEFEHLEAIDQKLDEILDMFIEQDFYSRYDRDYVMQYFGEWGQMLGWHPYEVMYRQASPSIRAVIHGDL
jgi:hypothetical protein